MKKLINFLPAIAILLASGLAVATTSPRNAPNVKWNGTTWVPLSGTYICLEDTPPCVAHRTEGGSIINVTYGAFVQLSE